MFRVRPVMTKFRVLQPLKGSGKAPRVTRHTIAIGFDEGTGRFPSPVAGFENNGGRF